MLVTLATASMSMGYRWRQRGCLTGGKAARLLYGTGILADMPVIVLKCTIWQPEDSPPRLVMSTVPRLAQQNDKILALLKDQNALMRELGEKRELEQRPERATSSRATG